MTQVIARQITAQQAFRQTAVSQIAWHRVFGRMAWQSLRILGTAVKHAALAFVNFWNIPALGATDGSEARSVRTTYHI